MYVQNESILLPILCGSKRIFSEGGVGPIDLHIQPTMTVYLRLTSY